MKVSVLFLLYACTHALYFVLPTTKEQCFGLQVGKGKGFFGEFVISGQGEENVITRCTAPSGKIDYMSPRKAKEGKFQAKSIEGGTHNLCFRTVDKVEKTISFEFGLDDDNQDEESLLGTENIDPLSNSLRDLGKQLDGVYRNIHFYQRREKVHRDLTEQTCDRVMMSAVIKMVVLALVGFLQIYILRGFFSGAGSSVKPI